MALTGHRVQGYCPLTITTAADGTQSEALGTGVITNHVVNFTGSRGSTPVEMYAGDGLEESEQDLTGDVKIELSQLEIQDEAALGGHTYNSETNTMVETEDDTPPYVRYAAIGVGKKNGNQFWRLVKYYKVQFAPADDTFATKQAQVAFNTHSVNGKLYKNADGKLREKGDYTTYAAALDAMKTFLGISTTPSQP